MERIVEVAVDGKSTPLTVNGMSLDNWHQTQNANNQNVLYIAVEYVKDAEYKLDTEEDLSTQNFNDFEQHVSPLDPNMSSVAQYSPVYTSDSTIPYNNPIVLVTNESTEMLSLSNSNQIVTTKLLHMVNEDGSNGSQQEILQQPGEVELLITDQNTGMQYSVSKEYLVEKCLAEDQQFLDNLTPDALLDSDLLALDDGVLKSQLTDIVVDPANAFVKLSAENNRENYRAGDFVKDEDVYKKSLRCTVDNEEDFLVSCVRPITDKPVLSRAWATLPESHLCIQKINENEFGVFAKKLIPKLTQFGPLEGTYVTPEFVEDSSYLNFYVKDQNGRNIIIDVSDENTCNWMRFVRSATCFKERNLVLVEIKSALYFINKETILPKQELKVGYSKSYAQKYPDLNLTVFAPDPDESNVWPCYECSKELPSSEELQKHLNVHDNQLEVKKRKRRLTAKKVECDSSTNAKDASTPDEPLNCKSCQIDFKTRLDLNRHLHAEHPTENARDDDDREKKAGRNSFDCPICHKTFATTERRQKHMLVHGSEESKPLQCDKCQRRFINNSALAYHLKTHFSDREQFECPICKETFLHVLQLKMHVKQHCTKGQFTCPHCQKSFSKYSIIRKHIRAFHCERKHQCPDCSKHFPTLDKLRMHLLKHSDHREFLCADCGKQFKRMDKLKEHCKRMHSEERENAAPKFVPKVLPTDYHRFIYKCHTCMVGFKRRGMLVNHLAKRHPDISPNSVPELNLPILRQTRDYFCQYCDKVYKSSSKRKAHILKNHPGSALPLSNRTHSSTELPNPTFSQTVGSVTTHPQSCRWCYKQYASKAKLLQHLRKKHSDILEAQNDSRVMSKNDEEKSDDVAGYQLIDGIVDQTDSDSRLYRLLTTNNMAPPR